MHAPLPLQSPKTSPRTAPKFITGADGDDPSTVSLCSAISIEDEQHEDKTEAERRKPHIYHSDSDFMRFKRLHQFSREDDEESESSNASSSSSSTIYPIPLDGG